LSAGALRSELAKLRAELADVAKLARPRVDVVLRVRTADGAPRTDRVPTASHVDLVVHRNGGTER